MPAEGIVQFRHKVAIGRARRYAERSFDALNHKHRGLFRALHCLIRAPFLSPLEPGIDHK